MTRILSCLFCLFCLVVDSGDIEAAPVPDGEILNDIVRVMYQGGEKLVYRVSWSGGIKIGELQMEVIQVADQENTFELRATVRDSGLFHFFYPVNDSFVTRVVGDKRLPASYEVIQREGSDYRARRHTEYDQQTGRIRYQKNDQEPVYYQVDGEVHNEFSSFFFTRSMQLLQNETVVVPTFVDGKRHEVLVRIGEETRVRDTIRGDLNVVPITPVMKFKGLYDKDGDTVIWMSNDLCRIPVRINSKILIGSLTADLVSYVNPLCPNQSAYHVRIPENMVQQQGLGQGD